MTRHSTNRRSAAQARSVRVPGSPWVRKEERALVKMWMRGLSSKEISKRIGRSPGAVAAKAGRLALPKRGRRAGSPAAGIRSCMRCRRSFHSFGPGNRICDLCKMWPKYEAMRKFGWLRVF